MKPTLNLASRTYVNRRALYAFYLLLTGLAVLALLVNGVYYFRLQGQSRQVETHLAEVEAKIRKLKGTGGQEINPKTLEESREKIAWASDLLMRDSFSWIDLLDRLEEVTPVGVGIQSIQPNYKEKSLALTAVSLDLKTMQTFIDNLIGAPDFGEVYLHGHSQVQIPGRAGQPMPAVGFSLNVKGAF